MTREEIKNQWIYDCNVACDNAIARLKELENKQPSSDLISLLKESRETIAWMVENMAVINPSLQSDAFNIPMNTLVQIDNFLTP
jgi:hypothetical protein